jgi:hypothetical protein
MVICRLIKPGLLIILITHLCCLSSCCLFCNEKKMPVITNAYFIYLSYKNNKAGDLLNPSTSGAYNRDSILIYQNGYPSIILGNGGSVIQSNTVNQLPSGYYYLQINLPKANFTATAPFTYIISLRKTVTDTLTFDIGAGSNESVVYCKYNNTVFVPPNNLKAFPVPVQLNITK